MGDATLTRHDARAAYIIEMATPPSIDSDLILAKWVKRTLTYGASILAVLSAALYFLFQTANKATLSPFGIDPSGFFGSPVEVIGGGLSALFVLSVVVFVLYWPIGWPVVWVSKWLSRKYIAWRGEPARLVALRTWVQSDPVKQRSRAMMVGGTVMIPLVAIVLYFSGAAIGAWRLSQATWLVSANECANGCFDYRQEGRNDIITGRPLAANSTRMVIFVGDGKIQTVELGKLQTVTVHKGTRTAIPSEAPWCLRWGWRLLDLLNANW